VSLFQWLDIHAEQRPNHPAIVDCVGGQTVSYAQFRRRSGAQAVRLQTLGVGAGDRVAVLSPNRIEILEMLFACARLGAILVPLNWRLSVDEQAKIFADCKPSQLFYDPSLPLPETDAPCRLLDGAGETDLPPAPSVEGALLILYTGGTTGVPKGAVLTHESIAANARNTVEGWRLEADEVIPVFTPMFHTGGLNVACTPLFYLGGTVVLPPPFTAESALEVIEAQRCTLVFLVPTMFSMLKESPRFDPDRLRTVRAFISGGAPCPQPLMEAYWEAGLPLRQGYGLTEAGPNNFRATLDDARQRPGTVGKALPGVELKLAGNGELLIRGEHVMAGYWQRATSDIEEGWLHTGDLARVDSDGFYYICGRSKEMYISGGENVFPAEVEEVLLAHPDVLEAAVVGVPDAKWGEVGRAYLVPRPGATLSTDAIAAFCQGRLARYKTPKQVYVMAGLPKSPAGKVLKRMLMPA
jgi:fatty-acyl-CoA synthase